MKKWSRAILCAAAVGLLPPTAGAQSSKQFDVCGGSFPGTSLLGFCASANVAVGMINNIPTVTIKLWNLSGSQATWDKSIAWSNIVAVGLTNVIPQSVSLVANSLKVTGPCAANPSGCDYSQYWWASNNVGYGGLVIDMFTMDARGGGIVSDCDPNNPLLTRNPYLYTACNTSSPNFVTMSFAVTQDFDLANGGDLFLKAMYQGNATSCVSAPGGNNTTPNCVPITAAPEPGTLALLGSGLASFGGFGMFRRRRKREEEA